MQPKKYTLEYRAYKDFKYHAWCLGEDIETYETETDNETATAEDSE